MNDIKGILVTRLKEVKAFWSHSDDNLDANSISDDVLIEQVLLHLDIEEIQMLFNLYPYQRIKEI